ncbi:MAG: hypothetical protein V1918_09465, partial [Planctomycetota bacterium]
MSATWTDDAHLTAVSDCTVASGSVKPKGKFDNATLDALDANHLCAFKLDEASGARYDNLDSSNDLADVNTVLSAAGKDGNAADFELDNAEYLSGGKELSRNKTRMLWAFWFKPETIGASQDLLNEDTDTSTYTRFLVRCAADGTLYLGMRDTSSGTIRAKSSTNTMSAGNWHCIVAGMN